MSGILDGKELVILILEKVENVNNLNGNFSTISYFVNPGILRRCWQKPIYY